MKYNRLACFLSVFVFLVFKHLNAQVYLLDQNASIMTCSGTIYDSGGNGSNYGANEDYTYIICPSISGQKAKIDFQSFNLGSGDSLFIYDGSGTAAPSSLIGGYGSTQLNNATYTSNTGCITLHFVSNGTIQSSGFSADLDCSNCQQINLGVDTDPDYDVDSLFIDICPGDDVDFTSTTQYPENGNNYTQSDATSSFEWKIAGQTITTSSFNMIFNTAGYYPLTMKVTDVIGCTVAQDILAVRVSKTPLFAGTSVTPSNGTLCVGDPLDLSAQYQPQYVSYSFGSFGSPVYLPDGSGVSYTTTLDVGSFAVGQTMTSISDLEDICVNMEHSYMGDLQIALICPNGSSIVLEAFPGGGGTFIGAPYDDPSTQIGVGWDYCWENSNPNGTWDDYVTNSGGWSIDTLPSGSYQSYDSFSNLIGCPLNGTWTLMITDNLAVDNGYIFGWSVNFDPALYPNQIGFTPQVVDTYWSIPDSIPGDVAQDSVHQGQNDFQFYVTDNFGCLWDTTISVMSTPSPISQFSFTPVCLDDQPLNFLSTAIGNNTITNYTWDFGDGSTSTSFGPSHSYISAGQYLVNLNVVNENTCADDTTILVTVYEEPTADFYNGLVCLGDEVTFVDQSSVAGADNIVSWNWNFQDGSVSTVQSPMHLFPDNVLYNVLLVVETDKGCVDSVIKPIGVYESPLAQFTMDKNEGCPELCINFDDMSTSATTSINAWNYYDDGVFFSATPDFNYCFDVSGIHELSLIVENSFGCKDTAYANIDVYFKPVANFTYQPDPVTMLNPEVHFLNNSVNSTIFEWEVDGAFFSGLEEPDYTFTDTGTYFIHLTASSGLGCISYDSIEVKVKPHSTVYVPDAFTPNNADGKNDVFEPVYTNMISGHWTIFNRWGQRIFEAEYPNFAWDGKENGTMSKTGIYHYVLEYQLLINPKQVHTKRGSVLLLK